jgi:hypothetical protein
VNDHDKRASDERKGCEVEEIRGQGAAQAGRRRGIFHWRCSFALYRKTAGLKNGQDELAAFIRYPIANDKTVTFLPFIASLQFLPPVGATLAIKALKTNSSMVLPEPVRPRCCSINVLAKLQVIR